LTPVAKRHPPVWPVLDTAGVQVEEGSRDEIGLAVSAVAMLEANDLLNPAFLRS